jgi:RHS repeat-associated protein
MIIFNATSDSPGSTTDSFKYDPFGRRIYKSASAGSSAFAYDGDNLVEETNSSGTVVARYSQGLNIDEPLAMLRSSTPSYYQADGLGSVTSLSNVAGSLAQTYTYDSFGKQVGSSGSLTNPFQYTAREFDGETSLQFSRRRYYDPRLGRFLSEDPIRGISSDMNFYAYVQNSSVNLTDATGLCPRKTYPDSPDHGLRLVPISDCVHRGSRRIVYELKGPDASCWWVTEHVDPPGWAPAAPAKHSPEGQSTGNENDGPGGFDDNLFGFDTGSSTQRFTISLKDPRVNPKTSSFPLTVQLPTGPDGQAQDYGILAHFHNGLKSHCINGNCTGWVPYKHSFDVPGF